MGIVSGIVVYFLTWWVVIFCVLPLNIKSIEKPQDGSMPGAPIKPDLKRKLILTTVISAVVWLVIYAIMESDMISFAGMAQRMAL